MSWEINNKHGFVSMNTFENGSEQKLKLGEKKQ